MIPAFRRRVSTRSGSLGNIVASSGNRTTARSRSASRSQMNASVCRCAISCICRKAGPMTQTVVRLPKCPRRLSSSPGRCSHCNSRAAQPVDTLEEQWLLVEWPREEIEPTKYVLSTLPAETPIKELVRLAKLRWRIERDYQELKQELGLGHFEGRSWRGFHHHATLCI